MYNKRTYILTNLDTGAEIVLDHMDIAGRNVEVDVSTSDKTWKRSVKDASFAFTFSSDYKFFQNAAAFLADAYENRDVQARVEFKEERYDSKTDAPYNHLIGMCDFADYLANRTSVSIPIKSGGLRAIIKSKRRKKVELGRLDSFDGKAIDPLITHQFAIANRSLPLNSRLEAPEDGGDSSFSTHTGRGNNHEFAMGAFPLELKYSSDTKIDAPFKGTASLGGGDDYNLTVIEGIRNSFTIYNVDSDKKLKIKYDLDFGIRMDIPIGASVTGNLGFLRFEGGESPFVNAPDIFSGKEMFTTITPILPPEPVQDTFLTNYKVSGELTIDMKKGDSLAFGTLLYALNYNGSAQCFYGEAKGFIEFYEESNDNTINRRSKCVFNRNAGEKLAQILTGEKNRYYSEYYKNGEFKLLASTTGKWIRGFLDSEYTTSFADFIANSKAVLNMAYNIETISGVETIVHEPLRHFFQQGVAFELPNTVSDVKRSVAKEFVFSSVSSGYKKPSGDNLYEEVSGLSEVSTSNEYIAPIDKITNDYNGESPYRADSEGKELTARQSILKFPTTDYRADKHIFNLDLKNEFTDSSPGSGFDDNDFVGLNSIYSERTWQDDYEIAPYSNDPNKPVFEPNTLTGLRLTPYRNMERHFWFLNNAYTKETNKFIRYASTRGNADFITKKAGKDPIAENGKYLIADIEPPLFVSKWIKFKHAVTDDIIKLLEGTTNINGRDIPNLYFKIGFINEFGEKEYGYLFELKPDKAGEWKLLKAL